MKKAIITSCIVVLLFGVLGTISAQTPPEVAVVLSADNAGQNEIITADVMVSSDDVIVGADIGIAVGECLRIEGRENGGYLPTTAENSGFVPFEELTESGTRLAANVLGQEVVADPSQYFFRATLRVLCDSGQADVTVTFAQLVNKELESYKLAENQIAISNASLTMQSGQPVDATAQVFPTPTEFPTPEMATAPAIVPSPAPIEAPPLDADEDSSSNLLLIIVIIALIGLVLALLTVLVIVLRRSQQS